VKRAAALVALAAAAAGVAALAANERPDPNAQAGADGCKRVTTDIYKGLAPNWVYVNDRNYPASGPSPPPQWATGMTNAAARPYLAAHPAGGDDPLTHVSFDFNVNVLVDPPSAYLVGTGNVGEGEEHGRLHSERETGSLPTAFWAERGDRISMLGSWVWDCDHFQGAGEHTEFHPIRAAWIERNPGGPSSRSPTGESEGDVFVSSDGTAAATQADCAHRTKGDPNAFHACIGRRETWVDPSGDYRFELRPPPRPSRTARLVVRVVDRGSVNAPPVNAVFNDAVVNVNFSIKADPGRKVVVAKQIFAGWTAAPKPVHLRLRFDSLLVRRAMDPGCPPDETNCKNRDQTLGYGQITTAPGEWQLYWDVAGIWGRWSPGVLRARDGQRFRGTQTVDFYVPRNGAWRLFALARECDFGALPSAAGVGIPVFPCPKTGEVGNFKGDDYPGALEARYRGAATGRHTVDSFVAGSDCPPSNRRGCFQLTYTVTRVS
jgi:hypothetical protein